MERFRVRSYILPTYQAKIKNPRGGEGHSKQKQIKKRNDGGSNFNGIRGRGLKEKAEYDHSAGCRVREIRDVFTKS